jgi:hypothetical protein
VLKAGGVEGLADGGDAAVHHVGRGETRAAGLGLDYVVFIE